MKLNFLNLGMEVTASMRTAQETILRELGAALGDISQIPDFIGYATEASFLEGFKEALADSDVVVTTVDPELFSAFKTYLAAALGLKMRSNRSLQKTLQKAYPDLKKENIQEQALLPAEADALLSADGAASGFAIKANRQILIALPLDPDRMEYIMQDSVLPYLRDHLDAKLFFNPEKGEEADTQEKKVRPIMHSRSVAAEKAEEEVPQSAQLPINEPFIRSVVETYRATGRKIAVADTKTVDFLKNVAALVNMEEVLLLSTYQKERGEETTEDYIVQLAKETKEQSEADLGAVLSKVYVKTEEDGTKNYYTYVAISDGSSADEAKVTAEVGDTPPELIYRSVEALFRLLSDWLEKQGEKKKPIVLS